jgi:hypothetical protein
MNTRPEILTALRNDLSQINDLFLEKGFSELMIEQLGKEIKTLKSHKQPGSSSFFADFTKASLPLLKKMRSSSNDSERCNAVFKLECEMLGPSYGDFEFGPGFTDDAYFTLTSLAMGDPSESVRAAAIIALAHPGSESFPSNPYHRARYKAVLDTVVGNGLDAIAAKAVRIRWPLGSGGRAPYEP